MVRSGKAATPEIGIWYDEEAGDIHLSLAGQGLSTVRDRQDSKCGNSHLFNKLARILREQGKPHPPIAGE
ncbi:MAG: hypothetical protein AB7D33_13690 [Sphingobium sp.]